MAALTARQERIYNHTADLYRPADPQNITAADGKVGPQTYTLAEAGVRCRINVKNSPSSPTPIGRVESDVLVAMDEASFAEDQAIDDGWWLVNKTLRPDGSQSNMYGRFWVVRGEPQRFVDSERRRGGRVVVMMSQESRAPQGITI